MNGGNLNELALCTGAGGGLLATTHLLNFRTICYVEHNPYRVEVIKARIRDGYLHNAPIWDDCRTFDGTPWRGLVDIITAGFPCQPFSVAGKRRGEEDDRNIWPDIVRIIGQVRPAQVFLENSAKLLAPFRASGQTTNPAYISRVLADLAEIGYLGCWDCIPASAIGAPHQRDRIWILAYANQNGWNQPQAWHPASDQERDDPAYQPTGQTVFHAPIPGSSIRNPASTGPSHGQRSPLDGRTERVTFLQSERSDWWATEPGLGRVANGVANRVDRLEAIGDGQVSAVAKCAYDWLSKSL